MTPRAASPRGFALLAVLWVVVGLSALAVLCVGTARRALGTAGNRTAALRATWRAEGCAESARAMIADVLMARQRVGASAATPDARYAWLALDRVTIGSPPWAATGCDVTLTPTGLRVDLAVADAEQVRAAVETLGVDDANADSMVDALMDWRDGDDTARARGAELAWYVAHDRRPPRNAAFAAVAELARVRGFGRQDGITDSALSALFTVEPGRIDINRAPAIVLRTLPGMTDEAVARMLELRDAGVPVTEMAAWSSRLTREARLALESRLGDLSRLVTTDPDAWLLVAQAHEGSPSVTATVEYRLERAGARAVVVRRRLPD